MKLLGFSCTFLAMFFGWLYADLASSNTLQNLFAPIILVLSILVLVAWSFLNSDWSNTRNKNTGGRSDENYLGDVSDTRGF